MATKIKYKDRDLSKHHTAKFQRIDVPYSMVLEWCREQYDAIDGDAVHPRWWHDGQNFYFAQASDHAMFVLRWLV